MKPETITWLGLIAVAITSTTASARNIPDKTIPGSVLMEVRLIENQFKSALSRDCAPDRCYPKGCVYEDHITLDQPRTASLPGLPAEDGPGAVTPQEYLTRVRCSFSHEKDIEPADVSKLARRLRRRLSQGWLTVAVSPQALEPIPKSLAESPEDEDDKDDEEDDLPLFEPEELTPEVALQQLWNEMLPHLWWMALMLFATLAILMLIWAFRRLGAQTIEDKMMEAQLNNPPPTEGDGAEELATSLDEIPPLETVNDDDFAEEQENIWIERLDRMPPDDDDIISRLLREWLKAGDYPRLARALFVFGDRVSKAFESAPELALKKVEFASYFRDVDENTLPSRAKFFRDLNQQAMASLLLSQDDVALYRSLREDFGSSGYVSLMNDLPPRYAALLYALAAWDKQQEVAGLLSNDMRQAVASELLGSTRISLSESAFLLSCVEAVQQGKPLPPPPDASTAREHGPPIDSARALSMLLPHIGSAARQGLFADALRRHGGAAPSWYEDIAFNHMLTALPDEMRNDVLLEVDIRGLAAWLQVQPPEWRRAFVNELSDALQKALYQNAAATSRADIVRLAKRGQAGLVQALKGTYARRGVKFADLVA